MKCSNARKKIISSLLDNRTDPMKDSVLAEHIRSCPKCRAELEFLVKYKKTLSGIKPVPAPENFMDELHRRIELEKGKTAPAAVFSTLKKSLNAWRLPLEAAGVTAIAVMVFFLYKPFFSDKTPVKTTDYAAGKPGNEFTVKTDRSRVTAESPKKSGVRTLPSEKKIVQTADEITADKSILKTEDSDNRELSEKEKTADLSPAVQLKKSRMATKDETKKTGSDKSSAKPGVATESYAGMKKNSIAAELADADRIFSELGVTIVQKNMLDYNTMKYKVNVPREKYSLLMKKLKEKFSVQEKITGNNRTIYEIELFLKKNKN